MSNIVTFKYNKNNFDKIKDYHFGKNWPVVYVLENKKEVYIGQTINAYYRSKQHYENPERRKLSEIHIITDEEFNVSATLDIESWLIQYISADGKYLLQNGNGGLRNHNYYDRVKYETKFEITWNKLQEKGIVHNSLHDLKNSDLFKYSPYKSLTEDQYIISREIFSDIVSSQNNTIIVNGGAGIGKTILATYLLKFLKEQKETSHLSMAIIVPMTQLRQSIKKVFKNIKGLSPGMVISPSQVIGGKYDLVIIDEAHRLHRPLNISNLGSHYKNNDKLRLSKKEGTELDWILKETKKQIFFYDEKQTVGPSGVRSEEFKKINAKNLFLTGQMRIEAGDAYIKLIDDFFNLRKTRNNSLGEYEFEIYDDIRKLFDDIKERNTKHGLSRVVAGYAWPWHTKPNRKKSKDYDIEIDGYKAVWNSTTKDWMNSKNAINEVGCIHTVQGYGLNYAGVIIGPEFGYDPKSKTFFVDKKKYFDRNGRAGVHDILELEQYIKNIYRILLTRGIKGTYVYAVDKNLRDYLKDQFKFKNTKEIIKSNNINKEKILSPYANNYINVPLVGSAPCGNPLLGEENIEDYIKVKKEKIKIGYKYFIVRAVGDSMNIAGINDQDLVLCRYSEKGETGDKVIALLGGENVTIKFYDKSGDRRILLPKSSNPIHKPIVPEEGDIVQGVVQEVLPPTNLN